MRERLEEWGQVALGLLIVVAFGAAIMGFSMFMDTYGTPFFAVVNLFIHDLSDPRAGWPHVPISIVPVAGYALRYACLVFICGLIAGLMPRKPKPTSE